MNASWWNRAETTPLRGRTFWRCIEKAFTSTVLESGPNFQDGGRFSVPREFSAIYFSENKALARLEKTQGRDLFEDLADLSFRIAADLRVPDLTADGMRTRLEKNLRVGASELTAPGVLAYGRTQPVGRSAFEAGLPGLVVPSTHPPLKDQERWQNLVLFPANILSHWLVRV